jgi:hypothetical protein
MCNNIVTVVLHYYNRSDVHALFTWCNIVTLLQQCNTVAQVSHCCSIVTHWNDSSLLQDCHTVAKMSRPPRGARIIICPLRSLLGKIENC